MKIVSADRAIGSIPDGSRVILPHGAVEPTLLYEALLRARGRFRRIDLYSGMQFGDYPFLREGLGDPFHYTTWQASPKLRHLFRDGRIDLLPMRFRDVVRVIDRGGVVHPDVVFVQVAEPRNGQVNLGISVSLFRHLIDCATLVIAEINANMPSTGGDTLVPIERIDFGVESALPLGGYDPRRATERDELIATAVLERVRPASWVQLGVGAIPDAVLRRLRDVGGVSLHSGMLTDGLVGFLRAAGDSTRVVTGELCGSPELYRCAASDDRVELHASAVTHDLINIASLPRFTAINSAIEVDLHGQINGEMVGGVQVSGVGGSLDFIEAAHYSSGGCSIVAMPSTTENGRHSKIVRHLAAGTAVTAPRFCADMVITEFGVAELRGKTLSQRAAALLAVAHPHFRDGLASNVE